jgi:predicted dehydrogenase
MILTQEQKTIGGNNFLNALGAVRREFLLKSLQAPRIGPYYFGYGGPPKEPVRAAIVGTGNEGCEAMIRQSSPEYLRYVAYFDLRPTQLKRVANQFKKTYGPDGEKVRSMESWKDLLNNKDVEAVVIATPLWTHAQLAVEAMQAGKHVLCEKLMARTITDAKEMVRVADQTKKILSIGHQRHYSTLYANVLEVVKSGIIGDIKHIRALWHRNNTWEYRPSEFNTANEYARAHLEDKTIPRRTVNGEEYILSDGWCPPIPTEDIGKESDYKKYGYESVEELVRWRLFNRTGGGLMAELGSHQLDACSLFLNKVHPVAVTAFGGHQYYRTRFEKARREAHDHVYCLFEMPGDVTLTYTSINTNSLHGYGEILYGAKGTLAVMNERDIFLFKEKDPNSPKGPYEQPVGTTKGADGKWNLTPAVNSNLSPDGVLADAALGRASWFVPAGESAPFSNRGYKEEIEAFADAVRNPERKVRCDGRVALADTVMALAANVAMAERKNERMEFNAKWYDPAASEVPDPRPTGNGVAGR